MIPWLDDDRLALIKVRQPEGRHPRYAEAFRDRPRIFPSHGVIRPGKPLIIVEGELDAILLGQELDGMAVVVTLGGASTLADDSTLRAMLRAPSWFLAMDADSAGDRAAIGWPARARRVRPPDPWKDWTEVHAAGRNLLRYVWCGVLRLTGAPWDDLAAQRWGPAIGDPTLVVVIDRPDRDQMFGALKAAADDSYAIEERAAIMEFEGGLSSDEAERAAPLSSKRHT